MQLTLRKEGDFVRLAGPVIKQFHEVIRYSIRPQTFRKFDKDRRQWLVHWRWLPFVAQVSRKHFSTVDWSELPTDWQMYAVGASAPDHEILVTVAPESDPYETLFVMENAPMEVVKASRDALLLLHHPDTGGSGEEVDEVVKAYKRICQLRSN